MFLIFSLGRQDVFSAGDAALRNAISANYFSGRKVSDRQLKKLSTVWAPYRSVASWYLWRTKD
jgi:DNA-3-methyladenine glycosylase II